jgi:hypothetical protein
MKIKSLIIAGLLFAATSNLTAQKLAVENVRFQQRKDSKVIVAYDLAGDSKKKYTVLLSLYIPQTKKWVRLAGRTVIGDVGRDIQPGRGKRIGWDLPADVPGGLNGEDFMFAVDAYLQREAKKWPLIVTGLAAAAGGGTALLLLSGGSSGSSATLPDLPGPPDLPGTN